MRLRGTRRRSRWGALLTVVLAAVALVVVITLDPGTALRTRELEAVGAEPDALADQRVELYADGELAATVVARTRDTSWGQLVRVHVERPRPELQRLAVWLGTDAAGLAPHAVGLATPSGDWPPVRYSSTAAGDLEFVAEHIDWRSTTVLELYVPPHAVVGDEPGELPVEVVVEQAARPSVTAWQGTVRVALALDADALDAAGAAAPPAATEQGAADGS